MKILCIVLMVCLTSCFYFPFNFSFLPSVNTKLILAAMGIPFFVYHMIKTGGFFLSKELVIASMIAVVFSLMGNFSVEYNNTNDYAYTSYIISMWIWFLGSYTIIAFIGLVHKYLSFRLLANYLIVACVLQCILALLINFIPDFKLFVDTYFITGNLEFLNRVKRLYGIGAHLDASGGRFAVVLCMISILLCNNDKVKHSSVSIVLYTLSFIIISIIGNVISRSTTIGMVGGIVYYLLFGTDVFKSNVRVQNLKLMQIMVVCLILLGVITSYFYSTNQDVFKLLRFGFEGFFNWIETGTWETDSTEKLKTMWVFPDHLKTWIIGDGYFEDPNKSGYFYMNTDVGYLRFIFYCGIIGLTLFSIFFIYLSYALQYRFANIKHLFIVLIILVFINWLKVSTVFFFSVCLFCFP